MTPELPASVWIAGCGYVGRALASRLHREGVQVLGLTRSPASARSLGDREPFQVRACDIACPDAVRALAAAAGAPEFIVHCASSAAGDPGAYQAVYHDGCANLLPIGCPLLFTSSTSVYDQTGGETVTETSPACPQSPGARILRAAEDLVLRGGGIVARLSGIYGPGRSAILRKFLDGTAVIETGPSRYLNQVHRDDIAAALLVLIRHRHAAAGQVYNVSDGDGLTQRSCCEALAAFFNRPLPPEAPPAPDRRRPWTNKRVDCGKLRALGWTPRYGTFLSALRLDPELVPSIQRQLG